ncbi:Protein ASI3 OS=Saccharomyces cerevisiae (strain ATCC 204508 / S288c) GN=ASI3 PE=1 SV=2 [Rhizoctonia solani AG-1 IB]|uniref:Protein ASI3 n=1 Tax=Thanatephorus cucumeris (strain AG1-IB / isolate 7/3/14) TaxID=1108050 RepID=A0A0B7FRS9_THACB|nr:Protein ASI3 OS=Saccharomyces cerevisiae (strain ATCC 204508 / S288c) GN=ASI3 PE=1 SV=2 [Rhizoctonia solani AG-1 IB]
MDALRSLPESLSAVRANLRHIVRELVGGKVEISYVHAPTGTSSPLPSPSPSPSPALGPQPPVDKMPSPWGFMTSGYALGLLLMAVLLNRIANVVVPPRQNPLLRRYSRRRRWLPSLLPINISATHTRFISRVPSMGLLATSLFLLTIALVQAADIWEPLDMEPGRIWYLELCRWAAEKEMAHVCWTTYVAVCVAMVMNTLTRGLEGAASDGPHAFNLLSVTYLCEPNHAPVAQALGCTYQHAFKARQTCVNHDYSSLASGDSTYFPITTIYLHPERTALNFTRSGNQQAFIPTTSYPHHSVWSVVHHALYIRNALFEIDLSVFHLSQLAPRGVFGWDYSSDWRVALFDKAAIARQVSNQLSVTFLLTTCKGRFVWNPFAEEDGLAHQSLLPSRSDDYAVALLKLGSACIEVTAMAGFGNEVSPIHTPDTIYISHSGPVIPKLPNAPSGLAREIKSVHAVEADNSSTHTWLDVAWTKEVGRFGERIARVARGVWGAMTRRGRPREEDVRAVRHKMEGEVYDIREVYARYLLGEEVMSDDEDDEFKPGTDAEDSESDFDGLSEGEEEQEEQEGEEEEDVSAPTLYADLARRSLPPQFRSRESSPSVPALTPMLIAHLTSPSKTPLTRNKYTALSYPPTTLAAPSPRETQTQTQTQTDNEDPRATCVVCTVEPRSVICWPCRCLALCDECRGSLASRMGAGKHQCPCCRRAVEGYSRIYIP